MQFDTRTAMVVSCSLQVDSSDPWGQRGAIQVPSMEHRSSWERAMLIALYHSHECRKVQRFFGRWAHLLPNVFIQAWSISLTTTRSPLREQCCNKSPTPLLISRGKQH